MKSSTLVLITTSLFCIGLLTGSNLAFGQDSLITIRYIGNCGLHMTDGTTDIYIDFPYRSGAFNYVEYNDSEIDSLKTDAYYIFTHKHGDHYSNRLMRKAMKDKNGKKYGKWNLDKLLKLGDEISDFKIEAFKTKHHLSFNHYSYLITWHGKKIYFSGDTESSETILGIAHIDWAFVPAWLISDMVDRKVDWPNLKIGMMAIYHIGPKDNVQITGNKFLMLKEQGKLIEISYKK